MHTLARIIPFLIAFTLGATVVEIKNLRDKAAMQETCHQALEDAAVDREINYHDGFREASLLFSGNSTSQQRAIMAHPVKGIR